MFDIGWVELLLVAMAGLVVIGPRDLPAMLRRLGRVAGGLRRQAQEFRQALEEMDQPQRPLPPYPPETPSGPGDETGDEKSA